MRQYCRYCGFCIETDVGYYCTDKAQHIKSVTSANNCKEYGYCGMDIVTGQDHEPKEIKRRKNDGTQISF